MEFENIFGILNGKEDYEEKEEMDREFDELLAECLLLH